MKINMNSWHFRLVDKIRPFGRPPRQDLCGYFWQVTLSTLLALVIGLMGCILILGVLYIVASAVSFVAAFFYPPWMEYLTSLSDENLIRSTLALGLIFWVGAAVFGAFVAVSAVNQRLRNRPPAGEPGLAVSYIQAKKAKICPIIEFVDEEKNES